MRTKNQMRVRGRNGNFILREVIVEYDDYSKAKSCDWPDHVHIDFFSQTEGKEAPAHIYGNVEDVTKVLEAVLAKLKKKRILRIELNPKDKSKEILEFE